MRAAWRRASDLLAFVRDETANFGIVFALASMPIMGLVGAAVDYTSASRVRQQLQEVLDMAAVAAAKSIGRPASEIQATAEAFVQANMPPNLQATPITVEFLNNGGVVRLRPTNPVRVPTAMLPIIGITFVDVTASAEATNGYMDLEIALVLDNTGSMSGTKISVLRQAVTNFVDSMERLSNEAGRTNSIKVGIVPFDRRVNMGDAARGQPWVDYAFWSGSQASWNGCVTDRDQSNDVLDTTPVAATPSTRFYASTCSLQPVMPLTQDWNALRTTASLMQAAGNTNVTIGLVHGWHLLTPNAPYTGAEAARERLTKVIILLTDGENTQNRWTTNGGSIDARTSAACTNVKNAGIQIYTIRVIDGDEALLRTCATVPSMYYNVTAPTQINTVFELLARQMSALRLSR
jgi:Flp pilus assembly protein TadG